MCYEYIYTEGKEYKYEKASKGKEIVQKEKVVKGGRKNTGGTWTKHC